MNSKEKFFSVNNAVSKKEFIANFQKLNYQRKLISDIENKHKEWSKAINDNSNQMILQNKSVLNYFLNNFKNKF